ncbi:nuclear pore complex protein NUP96 [Argentina anserina]|uniref:nuclear pore complex protein NUP96 n=1 Tax=Argentina anserina TaxID=57926 RepID=UPI0021763AF2|nr:nuclear pore complex protein NUP96 [Potentilla anserina]XP_050386593.1 nuclear pore complex protein NUP96 [Potentilla anserina]XP_050386594.1 nuclear pore complex protein NUP96 [Potentilla anserina]
MFSHTSPFTIRHHGGCHTSTAAAQSLSDSTPPQLEPDLFHGGHHKRTLCELYSNIVTCSTMGVDAEARSSLVSCQQKRRRTGVRSVETFGSGNGGSLAYLPTLEAADYYMQPSLAELAAREGMDPGYCARVLDFTVGRFGYGAVKYPGETDVRCLDLDKIVKFRRHEVIVYEDESGKPLVGEGLNKPAEVTLMIQTRLPCVDRRRKENIVKILRQSVEGQGAHFVSFNPGNGEWKFFVNHFSRFGLSEEDEEDMIMEDTDAAEDPPELNHEEMSEADEGNPMAPTGVVLSHSLPAHLGLDPIKMQEMRMLMFSDMDEEAEEFKELHAQYNPSSGKEYLTSPLQNAQRMSYRSTPPAVRKTPLALLEYKNSNFDSNSPGAILMAQENKGLPLKTLKEGFKLDLNRETPVTKKNSRNIVDAGLLMGRSFRVGWGPNGVLVHTGMPIGGNGSQRVLSSVINIEKVAIDNVVRDENNKVSAELVETAITSPLELHKGLFHETKEVEVGSFSLRLQKLVSNRFTLSDICRSYVDIIERQLEVPGLSSSACLVFTHQIMIWELIKVLFSERENGGKLESGADDEEEMVQDEKPPSHETEPEALPLIRRAEFSYWLQENVHHRVEEIISLNETNYLESILLLLSARQLDEAVELAASQGDVRLACLLSQSGGSMVNRSDIAQQLELWRINGLDFSFIEKDRIRLYQLLAGDVHGAFRGIEVDWKRFLGIMMWYGLAPNTSLQVVFSTYQDLLNENKAPYPVPIYIDGHLEVAVDQSAEKRYDLSYYLMMLHGNEDSAVDFTKTMFSAFSSTYDPLDYHMIWHQRAVLQAVGVISANDLHVLDMAFVSQLLCLGQCHWAIYVVLHMSHCEDFPYLHANLIREILFQYCDSWSSLVSQRQFIEDLGIPKAWLHEAMAVYFNYYGELSKALEHFIECENWQKAHAIFITSVAHTLFLSAEHSEIWRLATSMEDHKSEIENWDLGAGIYISFYLTTSSLQGADDAMSELDSVDSKNATSREFLGQLNRSLAVWGARLPMDVRVVYSKMADEICNLLLSDISEGPTRDVQLSCFDTVFSAPIPQDLRSNHLQDAVSLFTCFLSEVAT